MKESGRRRSRKIKGEQLNLVGEVTPRSEHQFCGDENFCGIKLEVVGSTLALVDVEILIGRWNLTLHLLESFGVRTSHKNSSEKLKKS